MSQWISVIELVGHCAGAATGVLSLVVALANARNRSARRTGDTDPGGEQRNGE
ncbi:hypothetical protein [Streptomyces sp. NPDC002491]